MKKKSKNNIQEKTSEIFYRIHSQTSRKELDVYKKNILSLIEINYIKNKDLLEVGCGGRASGIYTLSSYNPKSITAIDASKKSVVNTRNLAKKLGIATNIKWGNAMNLAFKDSTFDFVFSNGVIHHTVDPYKCFCEMTRVLKIGGYLFLGIYGYGGIWGKIIHPFGMFLGKIIPFGFMEWLVNSTGILRSQEASILDLFYTPIQKTYRFVEIESWFKNDFYQIKKFKSPKWFYNISFISWFLFGDGYIYVIGKKNE